jgi:signal transduction histidine kinase
VTLHAVLDLIACAGHLAVGILVLLRQTGSPMALPFGLLSLSLFAWNFADFGYTVSGQIAWHWLDLGLSPFSPALLLQLVATFVGRVRRYHWPLVATHVFFALLAVSAWLAFASPAAAAWIDSTPYSITFLGGQLGVLITSVALLGGHARRTFDSVELRATNTMTAAILLGALGASSDFWNDFGLAVPPVANIGTTVSALMMAVASLRFRFLGRNLTGRLAGLALVMAGVGLVSYLSVFRWLRGNHAVLMVATVTVTLSLIAALRQLGKQYVARRDRVEGLTAMGRFSAQMAHDLKNPLAALKGAIQYLGEEVSRGQSLAEQEQFLSLINQQVDRIHRVVDDYQRLANLQPRVGPVLLNDTIREVLALQSFAARGVVVATSLDDTLPVCAVDRDLVGRAIENLVRNAVEAMPQGGAVTVETSTVRARTRAVGALIAVRDTGAGMDARQSERAFDEFFSTKVMGSGLGLAFVRRVVRAHAGRVRIDSRIGQGTVVTMKFPVGSLS